MTNKFFLFKLYDLQSRNKGKKQNDKHVKWIKKRTIKYFFIKESNTNQR